MPTKQILKLSATILGIAGIILLLALIAIQFVPVNRLNPPVVQEPAWDSPQTQSLAERACFDCHSNETEWPWYSQIAPASWLVADHVQEGRAKLNFSEWGLAKNDDEEEHEEEGEEVEEIVEEVQEGEMPLPSYLLLHPEARLTEAEIEQLSRGLEATFGAEAKQTAGTADHD
jgi:mono/diheme cytochrome c family protein